jgi:phenylacetate-CoA ligase
MKRGFGSLKALEGRVGELLYRADGTPQSGLYFTGFFRNIPGVRQFQIVQKSPSSFIVRMVVRSDYQRLWEPKIRAFMREGLGDSIDVECEYVDQIKRSPSGKVRWVVNGMANDGRRNNGAEDRARVEGSHVAGDGRAHE